jgi:hypothetical protein
MTFVIGTNNEKLCFQLIFELGLSKPGTTGLGQPQMSTKKDFPDKLTQQVLICTGTFLI